MKKLMMFGGLLGFCIGIVFGMAGGRTWPSVLWRASVATLGAGWLIRWWGGIWVRALREGYEETVPAQTRSATGIPLNR